MRTTKKISYPIPVGYLEHEATHSRLNVYRNINFFSTLYDKGLFRFRVS